MVDTTKTDELYLTDEQAAELWTLGQLGETAAYFLERDKHDNSIGVIGQDDWEECRLRAALAYWEIVKYRKHVESFTKITEFTRGEAHRDSCVAEQKANHPL